MAFVIILVILVAVVTFVSAPFRRPRTPDDRVSSTDLGPLLAAREAKYREIRDAELDHSTGKLSDTDFEAVDRTLRGEAIEIMRAIDTIDGR